MKTNLKTIKKNILQNKYTCALFGVSLLFYLFFFILDGTVMCNDSPNYIDMNFSREPFYPLYLAFFRLVIPGSGDIYLQFAVLGQCILAAIAAFSIANYLVKELTLPKWFGFCILAMPMITSLLCRFAAKRGSMYSNSILTEGITISLYLLFIRYCYEYYLHQTKKSFIVCIILSIIGISTRKQMIVIFALFFLTIVIINIKKSFFKTVALSLLTAVGILAFVLLFDHGYNYILRGQFTGHTNDNRFIATMVFYTAEREYGEFIEDEEARSIFYKVYDDCDAKNYLLHSAPTGWFDEVTHFSDSYDMIQLYSLTPISWEYINEYYDDYDMEYRDLQFDRINNIIIRALLPHELPRLSKVLFNNILAGLVTTVAQRTHLLSIYAALVFIIYIILLSYLLFIYSKNRNDSIVRAIIAFSVITLISILGNVTLVSAVIFCQTRYTIYNMALFYISGMLMLYAIYKKKAGT